MLRAVLSFFTLAFFAFVTVYGQNSAMSTVTGKVLSAKDSSAISVSILYEKLPYYDDMGLTSASANGDFNFLLVKDVTYNISIRKDSYKPFTQEIKPTGDNLEVNFFLEVDSESEVIRLENVIFARGSDVLQQESFAELDQLRDRLRDNHEMIIQLEGHTDFAGNPTANLALSQARVEAVKKYLTKGGISKNRILTKAYGGTQPLLQDRTPDAMAKNRRVEVRIIKK